MGHSYSFSYIKQQVESRGYVLLSTEYRNRFTVLQMKCPEGHYYEATWDIFRKFGCKKCAARKREEKRKKKKFEEIKRTLEKEGYKALTVDYRSNTQKLKLICPEGHECDIRWSCFKTSKVRCQICWENRRGGARRTDFESIQEYAKGRGYVILSSKHEYRDTSSKLRFQCSKGHVFDMTWGNFKNRKASCRECSLVARSEKLRKSTSSIEEYLLERGIQILTPIEECYVNANTFFKVKCPKGHIYKTCWKYLQRGVGCPKCCSQQSRAEKEIIDLYKDLIDLEERNNKVLEGKELDIYFPGHKVAIEYCGLFWHSEAAPGNRMVPSYHRDKMVQCNLRGIRLLTIFEDEWLNNKDVCISRINNALNVTKNKIYARNCVVKEIDKAKAKKFLIRTHLQGYGSCKVAYGIFHDDKLVQVMTFGSPARAHTAKGKKVLEMKRLAGDLNVNIVGGASRLFKQGLDYAKRSGYDLIKSYCDLRWGTGNLYHRLGFTKTFGGEHTPHYTDFRKRYRNQTLATNKKREGKTERDKAQERQLYRIYDCGHSTWEYVVPK